MNSVASVAGHSALQVRSSSPKARLVGGERHREIAAVAGADADGAEGAGRRAEIGARAAAATGCVPNRLSMKLPGPRAAAAYCGPQLFCASAVSTERRWFSRSAPPMPPLRSRSRLDGDLVEIAAHLLDLVVDRAALRRAAVEQREEARAFAAHPLGLLRDPIEFGLLLGLRFLIAADLFILGGVAGAGAAVDRRQLPFEPDADRVALRLRAILAHLRHGIFVRLREAGAPGRRYRAGRRRSKSEERARCEFPAYPAIEG